MKKTSRVLALVLALVLAFSCVGAEAFAASEGNVKQYRSMVVMGDSVMRGCNLPGYADLGSTEAITRGVVGSTPYRIAQECHSTDNCFCTWQSTTLSAILSLIGLDDWSNDRYISEYKPYAEGFLQYVKDFCGEGKPYDLKEHLKTAELVIIELGLSDVFQRAKELTGIETAFNQGIDAALGVVPAFLKEMTIGSGYVLKNYPKLLDFIKKNNPNADVVIVGFSNLFSGLSLTDDIYLPIFETGTLLTGSLNAFLQSLAKQYGYMYADISNVPTPAIEQNLSMNNAGDIIVAVHPSADNGVAYMARQIINVLPAAEPEAPQSKAAIKIDLGFVDDVDYVMVDGLKIKNFSLKGNILTVPYLLPTAKTVTVGAVDETGKVLVQLYGLNYNLKTGYSAYRLLSNSDVVGTVTGGVKTVTNLLGGLFKK